MLGYCKKKYSIIQTKSNVATNKRTEHIFFKYIILQDRNVNKVNMKQMFAKFNRIIYKTNAAFYI